MIGSRAQAVADIDLIVNLCTAAHPDIGAGTYRASIRCYRGIDTQPSAHGSRFLGTALSPTLFMVQVMQMVRRVAQYAIARPSREICFTVVEQGAGTKARMSSIRSFTG